MKRTLDPGKDELKELLEQCSLYVQRFLGEVGAIHAFHADREPAAQIAQLPYSDEGKSFKHLLEVLSDGLERTGINAASPHHMGYVPGGGVITSALGDLVAAVGNEYAGLSFASPGGTAVENSVLDWLKELMGYPVSAVGNLASGGSIATLSAVLAARHWRNITPENIRKQTIYCTDQIHHCLHKALRIAGLHFCTLRLIEVDTHYKMKVEELRLTIAKDRAAGFAPFMVLASAGSTDVGVIDPLDQLATIAEEENCWLHVDAAFGGFFKLLPTMASAFKGIERSHSVVIDPHKGLFLAYGTGAVLIKDKSATLDAMHYRATYMQDAASLGGHPDPADVSPELTKHFRGLRMWLSLHYYGIKPFREALEEKLELAQYFHREVQNLGFTTGPKPALTAVIFRRSASSNEEENKRVNRAILKFVQQDGRVYFSSTSIDGIFWLRICILVFRTKKKHVDLLLSILASSIQERSSDFL